MALNIKISTGCDIVQISRIENLMKKPELIKKIFHPSEITRYEAEHLAGLFAVKEATFKALGLKSDSWLLIEIKHTSKNKPLLILSDELNLPKIVSQDCSISHDGGYAFAIVTILGEK